MNISWRCWLYQPTRAQIVLPDGYNETMAESLWPGAIAALLNEDDSGVLSVRQVGDRRWLLFEHDMPTPTLVWNGDTKKWEEDEE